MATSELSELFGEIALDTDRASRTFGFNRIGRIDWDNNKDLQDLISAYTDGVNAFMEHLTSERPFEFTLLKYSAKPCKNEDTMTLSRLLI